MLQKLCYLLGDEGFVGSFKELIEDTQWDNYGTGRNPKCDDCMVHSGYEGSAVADTLAHPLKALKVAIKGPRTEGPMAPEPVFNYVVSDAASAVSADVLPLRDVTEEQPEPARAASEV